LFLNGLQKVTIGAPLVLDDLPKYSDKIKTRSPPKKYYLWEQYLLLGCMGLGKNSIRLDSHRKKYFRLWLRYYCSAWAFEKIELEFDPPREKFSFLASGYNTTMVHGTYKSFNWYLSLAGKQILLFLATLPVVIIRL